MHDRVVAAERAALENDVAGDMQVGPARLVRSSATPWSLVLRIEPSGSKGASCGPTISSLASSSLTALENWILVIVNTQNSLAAIAIDRPDVAVIPLGDVVELRLGARAMRAPYLSGGDPRVTGGGSRVMCSRPTSPCCRRGHTAQTKHPSKPISVHPATRLTTNIDHREWWRRMNATMVGRK